MKTQFSFKTSEENIIKLKKFALDEKKTAAKILEEALELYYKNVEVKNMKKISVNNGNSFCDVDYALSNVDWDVIVQRMDDEVREQVHYELAPCSNKDFLLRYLELAQENLIIG